MNPRAQSDEEDQEERSYRDIQRRPWPTGDCAAGGHPSRVPGGAKAAPLTGPGRRHS